MLDACDAYYAYLRETGADLAPLETEIVNIDVEHRVIGIRTRSTVRKWDNILLHTDDHEVRRRKDSRWISGQGVVTAYGEIYLGCFTHVSVSGTGAGEAVIRIDDDDVFNIVVSSHRLELINDITWLVRKVREHYEDSDSLVMPSVREPFSTEEMIITDKATEDQVRAVTSALTKSCTYVWGPPGTGKTKVVLTSAVMSCAARGEVIFILAPTNDALDQTIVGLLDSLHDMDPGKKHVNPDKMILRLGSPTYALLRRAPKICECEYDYEDGSLDDKIHESKIFAMTLNKLAIEHDLFLDGSPVHPDHVFIDEAGYASIINSLIAFSYGCPVTFLGDHFQLHPVFEDSIYDDGKLEERFPLIAYAEIPSIYAEYVLCGRPHSDLIADFEAFRLDYRYTDLCALRETHRFGMNMAAILDRHVYKTGLHSSNGSDVSIHVIDSNLIVRTSKIASKSKVNAKELDVIGCLLSNKNLNRDGFVVLTPYVNQKNELKSTCPEYSSIFTTIHRSQGNEWDTVIVSVVDNRSNQNHHYFTSTVHFPGKSISLLNTAVSRARKHLVLVCDYGYWSRCEGEFLCALIRSSDAVVSDAATLSEYARVFAEENSAGRPEGVLSLDAFHDPGLEDKIRRAVDGIDRDTFTPSCEARALIDESQNTDSLRTVLNTADSVRLMDELVRVREEIKRLETYEDEISQLLADYASVMKCETVVGTDCEAPVRHTSKVSYRSVDDMIALLKRKGTYGRYVAFQQIKLTNEIKKSYKDPNFDKDVLDLVEITESNSLGAVKKRK